MPRPRSRNRSPPIRVARGSTSPDRERSSSMDDQDVIQSINKLATERRVARDPPVELQPAGALGDGRARELPTRPPDSEPAHRLFEPTLIVVDLPEERLEEVPERSAAVVPE